MILPKLKEGIMTKKAAPKKTTGKTTAKKPNPKNDSGWIPGSSWGPAQKKITRSAPKKTAAGKTPAKKTTTKTRTTKGTTTKRTTKRTTTKKAPTPKGPPAKKPTTRKTPARRASAKKPPDKKLVAKPRPHKKPPIPREKQIVPFKTLSSKKLKPMNETDLKYIEIITWLAENPNMRDDDAMKHFGCSLPTITRAKTRGRRWGQFETQAAELLKMALTKLWTLQESLQEQYNHVVSYNDNQAQSDLPGNPAGIATLGRLILDTNMKINEMWGIYSAKVSIDVNDKSALDKLMDKFDSIDLEAIGKGDGIDE
jgi:hypothetical protein